MYSALLLGSVRVLIRRRHLQNHPHTFPCGHHMRTQVEETAELKKQRQEKHEKAEQLKEDIKAMNRSFYCETCDKQYVNVGEWSNHMSSYDHHHTKVGRYLSLCQGPINRWVGGRAAARESETCLPPSSSTHVRKFITLQRLKEMREATLARAKKRSGGNQAEQDRMRQDREMQRRIAAAQ